MMRIFVSLCALLFSNFIFTQGNEFAIQSYKDAEEAYNNGKYETALSNLDIAETMLKSTNPKIQGLKLKSYKQMAIIDSIKNYSPYANYVTELKTKKSSLANDAANDFKNYSTERAKYLADKKKKQIYPIENITIGQSFSSINRDNYTTIDFQKPRIENGLVYYNLKSNIKELKPGIYEIVVNNNTDKIVKVTSIIKALTLEELNKIKINQYYVDLLSKYESNETKTESKVEKFNKTDHNAAITRIIIDEKTTYFHNFYTPTKFKDMTKAAYFFTEGFEIIQ